MGFQAKLAKQNSRHLLLGYPLYLVTPRSQENSTFIFPISVFRCRYEYTDSHMRIHVPAVEPVIVREWLNDQVKYKGWGMARLLDWLRVGENDREKVLDLSDEIPDFLEIPSFTRRLVAVAGQLLQQELVPGAVATRIQSNGETGYYNGLALFVESENIYTRSSIRDYEKLYHIEPETIASTALGPLFGSPTPATPAPPLIHPFPLSEAQLLAARTALSGPLTVITGPPGTGKSQVIASIMISAAASGRSVLLAARLHRAIDAVQERLEVLAENRTVLVRANEQDGFAKFTFSDALQALLTRAGDADATTSFFRILPELAKLDSHRWALLDQWRNLKSLSEEHGVLLAEIERVAAERMKFAGSDQSSDTPVKRTSAVRRWLYLLASFLGLRGPRRAPLGQEFRHVHFDREETRIRDNLRIHEDAIRSLQAELDRQADTPVTLGERIERQSVLLLPRLISRLDTIEQSDRQHLATVAGDAAILNDEDIEASAYVLVLQHMPLWAVTTLAVGSRIPFKPGLFDYVVFDEAAATDIASAIPLLFRAKAAVVVGDPMQLGVINKIDLREEGQILDRINLKKPGIGRFLQSRTSLFDLAASAVEDPPMLLNEHYRCHPDIAAYFNEAFYANRLSALTDISRLRVPKGFRPGLHWTDVVGPVSSGRAIGMNSAYSDAEANAIVAHLRDLHELNFKGSVGVVTFFAPQAKRINQLVTYELGASVLDSLQVKVFTANRFQGDERDVMLLSFCLAANMPSGARNFLAKEKRLLNVAISRARAVCHIFGNKTYALTCGIPHIEILVRRVNEFAVSKNVRFDDRFDSPWERRLYEELVDSGYNPIPQHPVAGRFLDLAIVDEERTPPLYLDIEVDGVAFHTDDVGNRLATDLWRDHQLNSLGWRVLRFWVYELRDDMGGCLERVRAATGN